MKSADNLEAKSAWIITWVGTSEVPPDPLVAVINYRQSAESVRELVEQLYIALTYGPREKLLFAKSAKNHPYRAKVYPFERIACGHNPWLSARRVSNLKYINDRLVWTEPPPEEVLRKKLIEDGYLPN